MENHFNNINKPGFLLGAVLVLFLSLGIAGCGGGGGSSDTKEDSPEPDTNPTPTPESNEDNVTLLDAGEAPYQGLSIQKSIDMTSHIEASSTQVFVVGATEDSTTVTADFNVRTTLSSADTDVQVSMIPVLNNYSASTFDATEALPGSWVRSYSKKGALTDAQTNDSKGLLSYNTKSLFSFPHLILAVPDAAVGNGARWRYTQEVESGKIQTDVSLENVGNENLTVSATTSYLPDDTNSSMVYSNTLQASYDKTSLIMRSGSAILEISQDVSVSVNGQPTVYRATDRITHTITEVAQ